MFQLIGNPASPFVRKVRVLVHEAGLEGEIEEVTVVDHFGVETQITFSQVKINPEIEAGEFSFEPPKGVEVINADGI